jgi:thiamine biosynthesis lipoprotein
VSETTDGPERAQGEGGRADLRAPAALAADGLVVETLACAAMATRFELVLVGADRVRLRAAGEAALLAIEDTERELSRFRSDGFVGLLNRIGAREAVRADAELWELLLALDDARRATGGAFDVCHGGPGGLVLHADTRRVALGAAGTRVDLGSVGKGVALDRAAEALVEGGVACALVHGGTSTVLALGSPPGRVGFGVRVARPDGSAFDVDLAGRALSVSAQHGQDRLPEGGHVVDARTRGRAAGAQMVAVLAERATLADLWSTALLAAGSHDAVVEAARARGVVVLERFPSPTPRA